MELGEVKVFTKIFCFGCQGLFKTTNFKCTKYNAQLYFRIREKKKSQIASLNSFSSWDLKVSI